MPGNYLKAEPAKRAISKEEPNAKDLEWLRDNRAKANRQIENDTMDLAKGEFPTNPDDDLYNSYADAATAWLQYQWAIKQSDDQGKTTSLEEYKTILAGIRTRLSAEPTDFPSSKKASYSTSYSSSLLHNIPGMTDQYGNLL